MSKKITVLALLMAAIVAATAHIDAFAMPDPNLRVTGVTDTYATVSWSDLKRHATNVCYQVELNDTVVNYPGEFSTRVPHGAAPSESVTFTITVFNCDDSSEIASDSVTVTVPAKKAASVSISGATTVQSGSTVRLSATISGGDDVSRATYQWTRTSGPSDVYPDRRVSTLAFTAPTVTADTTYGWSVTVTLANGDTATDTATVTVTAPPSGSNRAPTADAGGDQTVNEGDTVYLDGRGSTDDKSGLTYGWSQTVGSPTVTLNQFAAGGVSFAAPSVDAATTLTFRLTVTDSDGATDTDTVQITIRNTITNIPPSVVLINPNIVADVGENVTLSGITSDGDGRIVSYAWTKISGPSVTLANADTDTATFVVPQTANNKVFKFRFTATDDTGASASVTATVGIAASNITLIADAGYGYTVVVGEKVQFNANGTAYNGANPLTYTWTKTHGADNIPNRLTGMKPSFTMPSTNDTDNDMPESFGYTLTVTDGILTDTDDIYMTAFKNSSPSITHVTAVTTVLQGNTKMISGNSSGILATARSGETVTLSGVGFDPDNKPMSYSWIKIRGPSVTIDNSGPDATFTAPPVSSPTNMEFRFIVLDNVGATASETVKVQVHPNSRPTANAGDDQTKRPDRYTELRGTATDADGDQLAYSWSQVSGTNVTTTTRDHGQRIIFTTPDSSSLLVFEFTATDGVHEASDRVTVRVQSNDHMPVANAGSDRLVASNSTVTIRGYGYDAQGDALTYLWKQHSGPAVNLSNKNTPTVTFTAPTVFGESKRIVLNFTVSDDKYKVTDMVAITVMPPTGIPVVDAGPDISAREQATITLRGSATDRDTRQSNLAYTWTHNSRLDVNIANADRPVTTVELPAVTANTTITFTLTVTDGTYTDTDTMTVTIRDNLRHDMPLGPIRVNMEGGQSGTIDLPITNPDGDPLTAEWSFFTEPSNATKSYYGANNIEILRVLLSAETSTSFTFTPPVTEHGGAFSFLAKVSDGIHEDRIVVEVSFTRGDN